MKNILYVILFLIGIVVITLILNALVSSYSVAPSDKAYSEQCVSTDIVDLTVTHHMFNHYISLSKEKVKVLNEILSEESNIDIKTLKAVKVKSYKSIQNSNQLMVVSFDEQGCAINIVPMARSLFETYVVKIRERMGDDA